MTTYLFPGQGSQHIGMGESLFNDFPELEEKASHILGYSLKTLCLTDPNQQLNQTDFTQPALYVVNALSYLQRQTLVEPPVMVAGHSLGEYNALLAAGVFDFETGLRLVQKRGALMAQAPEGAMAAVVGLKIDELKTMLRNNGLDISIANYNSYTQTVLTGTKVDIEKAKAVFEGEKVLFIPLKVSGPFHSPLMQPAKEQFALFLDQFQFNAPTIPVIANRTATPYGADIKTILAEQISHSVLWTQTVEYILAQGETVMEEIGPGKVLMGLLKKIQQGR